MISLKQNYQPPTPSSWKGRDDTVSGRLFQQIQLINCNQLPSSLLEKSIVLLGFASDEGVRRNLGRPGAAQGPEALRKALCNIPLTSSPTRPIYDAGTICCTDGDLEKAQQLLGNTVAALRERGAFVIVLGGGHEVAWGNFQGLAVNHSEASSLGIDTLNFDAHFDLRPLLPENNGVLAELAAGDEKQGVDGAQQHSVYRNTRAASTGATPLVASAVELSKNSKGSSGTSFSQIHDACQQKKISWRYACFGIQPFGNTKELFETAKKINTTHCLAETMISHPQLAHESLGTWVTSAEKIHLTLCLDVFSAAHAPGVSAPQALGISPHELLPFFRQVLESGKVIGFDIAELNPTYDRDEQTAKLAAHFVGEVLKSYVQ